MVVAKHKGSERRALAARDVPARIKPSNYPMEFAVRMAGREKRPLGDFFELASIGINHVALRPGAVSALHHRHTVQDEFVYVLSGKITLVHDHGEDLMVPGDCVGFPHCGTAHHLENRSTETATYLEIGDRQSGDSVSYPSDDLQAVRTEEGWRFERKNGEPY